MVLRMDHGSSFPCPHLFLYSRTLLCITFPNVTASWLLCLVQPVLREVADSVLVSSLLYSHNFTFPDSRVYLARRGQTRNKRRSAFPQSTGKYCRSHYCTCKQLSNEKVMSQFYGNSALLQSMKEP